MPMVKSVQNEKRSYNCITHSLHCTRYAAHTTLHIGIIISVTYGTCKTVIFEIRILSANDTMGLSPKFALKAYYTVDVADWPDPLKVNFWFWKLLMQDFPQVGCHSCRPTNSVEALKGSAGLRLWRPWCTQKNEAP